MKRDIAAISTFKYGTGTITAGLTHVHITHGCGSAPSSISVTPGLGCEAPIQALASEISATEFVVRFVGDVTLLADAVFLWGAMI